MWTEASLMQGMRDAIRPHLPEKAFLKRDRGEGLLVTNAPVFDPDLNEIPGFILERQGQLLHILPDESWIAEMERTFPRPPCHFAQSVLRFRGEFPDRQNLMLCVQGLKMLDTEFTPSPAEISAYERTLRQRTALALRGGACGGGLYAAALILVQINTIYKKGETPT